MNTKICGRTTLHRSGFVAGNIQAGGQSEKTTIQKVLLRYDMVNLMDNFNYIEKINVFI